jgi:hypothetical protein
MAECTQSTITDAAFAALGSCVNLNMSGCVQEGITPAALASLRQVRALKMMECRGALQREATRLGLPVVMNEIVKSPNGP